MTSEETNDKIKSGEIRCCGSCFYGKDLSMTLIGCTHPIGARHWDEPGGMWDCCGRWKFEPSKIRNA